MARVSPTWQGQGAGATWHPLLAFSACSEPHPRGMTGLPPLQNRGPKEGAGGPACGLQPSVPSPHLQPSWDLGRRAVFPPKPFGTVIQVPRDECWVLSLLLSTTETQTHPSIPRIVWEPSLALRSECSALDAPRLFMVSLLPLLFICLYQ